MKKELAHIVIDAWAKTFNDGRNETTLTVSEAFSVANYIHKLESTIELGYRDMNEELAKKDERITELEAMTNSDSFNEFCTNIVERQIERGALPGISYFEIVKRYEKQMEEFTSANSRAMELLKKGKKFIVVACDEPYYLQVYELIRQNEKLWYDAEVHEPLGENCAARGSDTGRRG